LNHFSNQWSCKTKKTYGSALAKKLSGNAGTKSNVLVILSPAEQTLKTKKITGSLFNSQRRKAGQDNSCNHIL
jgi:nickel-dependent lactate racemase